MEMLAIRSGDFDVSQRVEAFQDVVSAITKVDFVPEDLRAFRSETEIGVLPGVVIGYGRHSASTAFRTPTHAAETGDSVMFHIPLSGSSSIEQRGGGRAALSAGLVYADPSEVPGVLRFHGQPSVGLYVSVPRAGLAAATQGLNAALRHAMPLTPQWRLLQSYVQALHADFAALPSHQLSQCASHLHDLVIMALGATGDAADIAAGRGAQGHNHEIV